MSLKIASFVVVSLVLTGGIALAQQAAPAPPSTPPAPPEFSEIFSMFPDGSSYIGVHTEDINRENMARFHMREPRGVGITQVIKDSPAEKAGLRKDDVIVRFGNDNVTSTRKLSRLISEVAPDQVARLTINRGGSEQEVSVTVGKRENTMTAFRRLEGFDKLKDMPELKNLEKFKEWDKLPGNVWKWEGPEGGMFAFAGGRRIGITTTSLTKQLADYFGVPDEKGVLVTSVGADSPAAKAGLQAGDVITAVDGEKIDGAGDISRIINKKKDGDVSLTVIRNKGQRNINVTPKEYAPAGGPGSRTIVVPRVQVGAIPEMKIVVPRIEIPAMPEVKVTVPAMPKVRVIRAGEHQPL